MAQEKFHYFESNGKEIYQDYIKSQNNCVLCGTVLEIRHLVDSEKKSIQEEAHCTECEVRTRNRTHTLN